MSELLPCPFCGSEDLYVTFMKGYLDDTAVVFCNTCKVSAVLEENEEQGSTNQTRARAIEAWNKRAERTCERVNKPDQFFADDFGYSVDAYRCSVCNFRLDRITNYCPNCGARVEGSE